jgi:predicted RNase H-like HicB family nuclease
MLTDYVDAAIRKAKYKLLDGDEGFFGEIPGFRGVWANAGSLEACRDELREVLEDWILVRIRLGLNLPVSGGIDLNERKGRKRKVA